MTRLKVTVLFVPPPAQRTRGFPASPSMHPEPSPVLPPSLERLGYEVRLEGSTQLPLWRIGSIRLQSTSPAPSPARSIYAESPPLTIFDQTIRQSNADASTRPGPWP